MLVQVQVLSPAIVAMKHFQVLPDPLKQIGNRMGHSTLRPHTKPKPIASVWQGPDPHGSPDVERR